MIERRNGAFSSSHPGGSQFLYGDGHVQFISNGVEPSLYQTFSTINGGDLALFARLFTQRQLALAFFGNRSVGFLTCFGRPELWRVGRFIPI